ncbi:MIF4G like-domain-containing protein [Myxozyma melibiosi]|uniref:MIF4G like-domain-containing protein n=1 Tax=Myxozyma melibiosi TaxID=54550 RepID=A0ABR1F6G0_9ASCO
MSEREKSPPYRDGGNKRRRDSDGAGDNYRRHGRRSSPALFPRLRKLFSCLGEPGRFTLVESLDHCSRSLADAEFPEDNEIKDAFFTLLCNTVIEQPIKTFSIAVSILVANGLQSTVGEAIIPFVTGKLQELIDAGEWNNVKLLFRFLLFLSPMTTNPDVLYDLLDSLLTKAIELKEKSSKSVAAYEIYRLVLLTIPYIAIADPADAHKEWSAALLDKAKTFNYASSKSSELLNPFVDEEAPYKVSDTLDLLLPQLEALKEKDWELNILHDYSQILPSEFEKHEIPAITVPGEPISPKTFVAPEMYLKFFINPQVETTPPLDTVESVIFRDMLTDLLINLNFNRQEAARQLLWFDAFFRTGLFCKAETSLEKIAQIKNGSTWKPEDVAVETVLAGLFKLPKSDLRPVYFHSVLIEACMIAPHAVAPVLGRAIRFLYGNLEHLDVQTMYLLADWFAHHLSNFSFTWRWKEWIEDLSLNELHPKYVFIRELIGKELRLSFPQRIKETFSEEFEKFLYNDEDLPPFTFAEPDAPYSEEALSLIQKLRERAAPEVLEEILDRIKEKAADAGEADAEDPDKLVREIYVTAIAHLGARSLSHAESWIERGLPLLKKLCPAEGSAQREAVAAVFAFWHEQTGTAVQVVKKLMNQGVISPQSVVEWILIDIEPVALTRGHSWELLGFAIDKAKWLIDQAKLSDGGEGADHRSVDELTEQLKQIFVSIVRELSRPVPSSDSMDDETLRWLRWWREGFLRAFLRNYHEDYKELEEPLKNLGLTDVFILSIIEQTSDL